MFARLCVALVSVSFCATIPAVAQDNESLLSLQQRAAERAQTKEGAEAAIDDYHALIDAHMANQAAFEQSLFDLAKRYEQADRVEDGVRYFMTIVDAIEESDRSNFVQKAFSPFLLKHEDVVRKVYAEMQGTGKSANAPAVASKDIVAGIVQRDDAELREASLNRVRQMLGAESDVSVKAQGLATLAASLSAQFDHASFLPLVLPLLKSEDANLRSQALTCLPGLKATHNELPAVAALADDVSPVVRSCVAAALIGIGNGEHADIVVPALVRLLRNPDEQVVDATLRSMWGQYPAPELDEVLITLSRKEKHRGNAIYFGLSTQRTKSAAVCARLVEELANPDWNDSGRAAWGLTYGVPADAKAAVEKGLLGALPHETNPYTREQEFTALRQVASMASVEYLKSVSNSSLETEKFRQMARDILAALGA